MIKIPASHFFAISLLARNYTFFEAEKEDIFLARSYSDDFIFVFAGILAPTTAYHYMKGVCEDVIILILLFSSPFSKIRDCNLAFGEEGVVPFFSREKFGVIMSENFWHFGRRRNSPRFLFPLLPFVP